MAYTDFRGLATILRNAPPIRVTLTADAKVGDLLDKEFALADASAGGGVAHWVAMEDGDSGGAIEVSEWVVLRKPTTVGAGGATTVGDHSGALGDTLFLSTTAGAAVEAIDGDGIYQIVGQVLSTEDVYLRPRHGIGDYYEVAEKETAAKTSDENDGGKVLVCTGTTNIVVTLQATAVGDHVIVINGSQDGDKLTSISPNGSDKIIGLDFAGTDDKDAQNTKATSKAGDYMELVADGVAGWSIVSHRGVWAAES